MEFNEKLQELRKKNGMTQEELAKALYVSRTAVSKWESGRGYPNIDSIKEIAKFFSVTIDELLSSNEALSIAEEDSKEKEKHFRNIVYGLLDVSTIIFFFLPLFGQKSVNTVQEVSLLLLTHIPSYLRIMYYTSTIAIVLYGILTLVFQNCLKTFWMRSRDKISLILNVCAIMLFVISSQPYATTILFIYLAIKASMLIKW